MENGPEILLQKYKNETDFEKRLSYLSEFVNVHYGSFTINISEILTSELNNCIEKKSIDGEALIRYMISYSAFENADIETGQFHLKRIMQIFDSVKNHDVRAQIYNFLSFVNSHQGNYEKAFYYAYESIKELEHSEDKKNKYWGVYSLGVFYFDLKDYVNAEKHYLEAANKFALAGNGYGKARAETGLSSVYIQLDKLDEAESLLKASLEYYTQHEISSGQSRSYTDLGTIYKTRNNYQESLSFFLQGLEIRKATNHTQGIATSLNEVSDVLLLLNKFDEAEKYLNESLAVCQKINNKAKLYRAHFLLSQLYRKKMDPWKALEHYEMFDKIKSEVMGETANNKINELQKKIATDKAEKETEIHRLKNVELKKAYEEIEIRQKEIIDSIRYAKRIQQSLLTPEKYIARKLIELNMNKSI